VRPDYVQPGDFLTQSGYDGMKRLLALDEPPDAVAAACDAQAVGAIQAIEEAGLRCPEDIAVTGFDDAVWAGLMRPALTTVRQPATAMGAAAVDSALAMIENPALEPPRVQLAGELVVRESCGAPYAVLS
jgi:LacI family transcriptional regulator